MQFAAGGLLFTMLIFIHGTIFFFAEFFGYPTVVFTSFIGLAYIAYMTHIPWKSCAYFVAHLCSF